MSFYLVDKLDYHGTAGIEQVRFLQEDLSAALRDKDWDQVRVLDKYCMMLVDKVIAANKEAGGALILALNELKTVYASMIMQCNYEVNATTH